MPFQSEKQRRYLHANHPEIAKRWEEEYATGGISNHFRKKFKKGSYSRSYNPGAGGVVQHRPVKTKTHHDGGGDGPPSIVHAPKGPTAAEIAAAEAKKAIENKKRQEEYIRGFKKDRQKKKGILDKWKDHATASEHMDLTGFGSHEKKGYNFAQNFPSLVPGKVHTPTSWVGPALAKGYQYAQELGRWGLGPKWGGTDISLVDAWKKAGVESDANIKGMIGEGFDKDEYAEWMKEQGYTAAKGGVARKKYYDGGILDITGEEEITTDDGNDIELTAYNAEFDDPNDLSTGVKTLFQAKNGGKATKNIKGQPHMLAYITPGEAKTLENLGGQKTMTKEGIPAYPPSDNYGGNWGSSTNQGPAGGYGPYGGGADLGADQEDDVATMETNMNVHTDHSPNYTGPDYGWVVSEDEETEYGGADYIGPKDKVRIHDAILDRKNTWDKDKHKRALTTGVGFMLFPPTTILGALEFARRQEAKKKERIAEIESELALLEKIGATKFTPHTDTLYQRLEQEKLDLLQPKKPKENKGDNDAYPPVVPIHEEIQAYENMAWDPMFNIRSKQALNAQLQSKWAEERAAKEQEYQDYGLLPETDNPIVLNNGGLANLFRVKNQ